jgi:hypothetical protein
LGVQNGDVRSAVAQRLEAGLRVSLGNNDFHTEIARDLGDELAGGGTIGQDGNDD